MPLGAARTACPRRIATQEQYQALRLTSSMPVLRTLRVVHGDADDPVEVTVMVKAGHLYEVRYDFPMV